MACAPRVKRRKLNTDEIYHTFILRSNPWSAEILQLSARISRLEVAPSFPFLKLPAEIRNHIYRFALVVDGEINRYPAHYQAKSIVPEGQSKPAVALLRVCKQVGSEAQSILYGENTWRLNQDTISLSLPPLWRRFAYSPDIGHIGHIVTSFDYRDLNTNELGPQFVSWSQNRTLQTPLNNRVATASEIAHYYRLQQLQRIWLCKIDIIQRLILRNDILMGLTVDLSYCYCDGGCCRQSMFISGVLAVLRRHLRGQESERMKKLFAERLVELKIRVTGLLDKKESGSVHKKGLIGEYQ
ncbi:MAG: hypothetical protein Q9166_004019 [cf. Caloplaca sp. 2 TL-2023]